MAGLRCRQQTCKGLGERLVAPANHRGNGRRAEADVHERLFLSNQVMLRMAEAKDPFASHDERSSGMVGLYVRVRGAGPMLQRAGKDEAGKQATGEKAIKPFEQPKLQPKDVRAAIDQFKNSDAAKTAVGRRVLSRLEELYKEEEIGLEDMPVGLGGEYRTGSQSWGRYDLGLSELQSYNAMALKMTHEAVHALEVERHSVDDEMAAFDFEADYYEELKKKKLVNPAEHDLNEDYLRLKAENRAVDVLFPKYAKLLDVAWIRKHKDDWGGLANRLSETRAAYVNSLLEEGDSEENLVFRIVSEPMVYDWEFHEMIAKIGDREKGDFAAGLRRLNVVFTPAHRDAFNRIIQTRMGSRIPK